MSIPRYATGIASIACAGVMIAGPAAAHTNGHCSATALQATGPIAVPAVSQVNFNGRTADRSLLKLPANKLVSAKVLHSTAKERSSRASVADLAVKQLKLSAHLVTAKCEHGKGHVDLASVRLGKKKLAVSPAPNSAVHADLGGGLGTATVTLNKQTRQPDGSLRVTAIEAQVPLGKKTETVTISTVNCGPGHHKPGKPGPAPTASPSQPAPSPTQSAPGNKAPAPTPVVDSLNVTTGPPDGGTDVIVSGSGFTPGATVTVGGTAATVTYLGPSALEISTPAHSVGVADVVVHTPGGDSATSNADQFTYGTTPSITPIASLNSIGSARRMTIMFSAPWRAMSGRIRPAKVVMIAPE